MSGAPLLYPVLGALADAFHGLVAARCFSLACMLLGTTAVYLTGRRMFGLRAGFAGAAVFALLGPTLQLGAYASFDALALCLVAWSAHHAIGFAYGDKRTSMLWAVGFMVLADAVKYASLMWTPLIILLAAAAGPGYTAWRSSRSWNLQRFTMVSICMLAIAMLIGREPYFTGLTSTIGLHEAGTTVSGSSVRDTALWVGPLFAFALLGYLLRLRGLPTGATRRGEAATAALLLLGGIVAPVAQIFLGTTLSLDKHLDIGATFAAVLAGWALSRVSDGLRVKLPHTLAAALSVILFGALIAPLALAGNSQAQRLQQEWPDATGMVAAVRPLVGGANGNYLVENASVPAYYLGSKVSWTQWHDTGSASYALNGVLYTGTAALAEEIANHRFSVIVLDYAETPHTDQLIHSVIGSAGYKLTKQIKLSTSLGAVTYYVWVLPTGIPLDTPAGKTPVKTTSAKAPAKKATA